MKQMILLLCVLAFVIVGCAAPPEDLPRAAVVEDSEQGSDVVAEVEAEEMPVEGSDAEETVVEASEPAQGEVADVATETKAIDTSLSSFEFEGYAVGKSHIGTFDEWSGSLTYENDVLVGAEGELVANTVNTGIGGLDTHLQSDDFFDVEQYPTISIVSTEVEEETIYADLTFRGVTKNIAIPVTQANGRVIADFLLDTTDFDFKYTAVNSEVRIAFDFIASE